MTEIESKFARLKDVYEREDSILSKYTTMKSGCWLAFNERLGDVRRKAAGQGSRPCDSREILRPYELKNPALLLHGASCLRCVCCK